MATCTTETRKFEKKSDAHLSPQETLNPKEKMSEKDISITDSDFSILGLIDKAIRNSRQIEPQK